MSLLSYYAAYTEQLHSCCRSFAAVLIESDGIINYDPESKNFRQIQKKKKQKMKL